MLEKLADFGKRVGMAPVDLHDLTRNAESQAENAALLIQNRYIKGQWHRIIINKIWNAAAIAGNYYSYLPAMAEFFPHPMHINRFDDLYTEVNAYYNAFMLVFNDNPHKHELELIPRPVFLIDCEEQYLYSSVKSDDIVLSVHLLSGLFDMLNQDSRMQIEVHEQV